MESYDIVGLYDCFLSFSIMFSKFINAVACISTSFFIAKYSVVWYTTFYLSIYQTVDPSNDGQLFPLFEVETSVSFL